VKIGLTRTVAQSQTELHRTTGAIALIEPQPNAAKAQTYFEQAIVVPRAQRAKVLWPSVRDIRQRRIKHNAIACMCHA
jgi:hypothetical protein